MNALPAIFAVLNVVVAAAATPDAASPPATPTVTVVPGAHYQASWLHRVILGPQWREAWATPIEVPVVDLDTFDGGLTVDRQGGGNETFNLHFKSANGRTWVFRSVDKNPRKKFDPETAQGWIGDLAQDLIAGAHPCAPLVVGPIAQAMGVRQSMPQLAVMPDVPRLGEFRAQFAGLLGTLEERVEKQVPGADRVEDTIALFERLDERNDERVDARDYLRARLLDILVGDWDRHDDQWRWVRAAEGDEKVWHVVPRDRDEAFSKMTGALPSLIEYYGKPIVGWGDTYPPIDKITFAGRYTDRRFLVQLERAEWEAVTADAVSKVTDSVIIEAVHRLPPPMYVQAGEQLERALRSRRDHLTEASREFYRLLARDVDVRGSTRAEEFDVERLPDGSVTLSVYALRKKSGERAPDPHFRRTFLPGETSEIRLYTMGGDDRVIERGNGTGAILLRVVSPPATAELVDRSNQASATKRYAPLPPPRLPEAQRAAILNQDPRAEERLRYEVFRDWGHDNLFFPQLSYDSTRGLLVGAYLQRTSYGFGLDPYQSVMNFGAAYSTALNRPRLEYGADFRTRSPVHALVYLAYSGIEQAKFYGFGNDTARRSNVNYDARQDQIVVSPVAQMAVLGNLRAHAGVEFKYASSVESAGRFIESVRPEGMGGMSVGSVVAGLAYDQRSGAYPSQQAISARLTVREAPAIFSNPSAFTKLRGEASALYGWRWLTNFQFSEHVSGERNFGTYPFFEAAYLGGLPGRSPLDPTGTTSGNLLRGYDLNRFAGDAAVVSNTELAVELGKWSVFLPLRYGVWGLFDAGRVFVNPDSSSTWHTAAGGGVWFGLFANSPFFNLAGSMKLAVVRTEDGTGFLLASGFGL